MFILMLLLLFNSSLVGMQILKKAELVDIAKIDSRILVKLIFADKNAPENFTHQQVYPKNAKCLILKEAGYALRDIQTEVEKYGYGLYIGDAYRPLSMQRKLWESVCVMNIEHPEYYVADPSKGGYHTRGTAVDVMIIDAKSKMPLKFPPITYVPQAHHDYDGDDISAEQKKNRDFLKSTMERYGFEAYEYEWWHYNFHGWKEYAPIDEPMN